MYDSENTNDSIDYPLGPKYEQMCDNIVSNTFFECHTIENIRILNNSKLLVICDQGEPQEYSAREAVYKLEIDGLRQRLRKESYHTCKHDKKKNYSFYCYTCKKNICDECKGSSCRNHIVFNFDNNYDVFLKMGKRIEENENFKYKTNKDIKKVFEIIFDIYKSKETYMNYSFFMFIEGYYYSIVVNDNNNNNNNNH